MSQITYAREGLTGTATTTIELCPSAQFFYSQIYQPVCSNHADYMRFAAAYAEWFISLKPAEVSAWANCEY